MAGGAPRKSQGASQNYYSPTGSGYAGEFSTYSFGGEADLSEQHFESFDYGAAPAQPADPGYYDPSKPGMSFEYMKGMSR